MKITLNIDDQILVQARETAIREGITLAAFIENAIKLRLLATDPPPPYKYQPTVVEGSSPPNVDITKRGELYDAIEDSSL